MHHRTFIASALYFLRGTAKQKAFLPTADAYNRVPFFSVIQGRQMISVSSDGGFFLGDIVVPRCGVRGMFSLARGTDWQQSSNSDVRRVALPRAHLQPTPVGWAGSSLAGGPKTKG